MTQLQPAPALYTRTQRASGDTDAIVRRHLPLVRRIAWHVHGHMSSMVDVEDLVQIGLVALVEAVPMFEDRGQVTFEQYLSTRLRGAMIDELRRQATISRGAMQRRRQYQKAVTGLTTELGRAPVPAEIATRLGVPLAKLRQDYADIQSLHFDSIDDVYTDEGPWFMDEGPDAFEALAEGELRTRLIAAISALPEREAQVVQLYYVEELNLEEIGQVLGVGAARVCQIKKSAHDRLKKALRAG
ncbi:sigma-70 family RNA polymerase sigma factor [Sphingomonas sp. Leaf4]|uniref:sigma-70 family RNA polymerase sigma factor n=1 Tax=Sphingomonas sp. Leaf4 TaxID=2876553 RepID=UPI001E5DF017|nr:RNA polymerase sigma factor FliA [Sphingomonas sp. Leaf4]